MTGAALALLLLAQIYRTARAKMLFLTCSQLSDSLKAQLEDFAVPQMKGCRLTKYCQAIEPKTTTPCERLCLSIRDGVQAI